MAGRSSISRMAKSRSKHIAVANRRGRTLDWLSDHLAGSDKDGAAPRARALIWLRDHGSPRVVMSLMLASTIGCGFMTSLALHGVGLGAPIVRYPLAVLSAWAVFLGLVSVWVWWQRRENVHYEPARNSAQGKSSGNSIDLPIGSGSASGSGSGSSSGGSFAGGGGRFGGGGASDSFAEAPGASLANGLVSGGGSGAGESSGVISGGGGSKGGGWDLDLGGDDGGFIVLLIGIVVVAAAVFGVVFYAVYSAPTFFAELLIDGGVGTWLYKRADVANRPDWLSTAVQRSVWPVVVLLAMFIALALVMRHVAPGSTTLGQAWHAVIATQ